MGDYDSSRKIEEFLDAIQDKTIPVLTLDHKWYRLLNEDDRDRMKKLEDQLNALLKRQGKLNTETRDIRLLKKKLMREIMPMVDAAEQGNDKKVEKQIEDHKRLIEECNEKLESYKEELLELPKEIQNLNRQLMLRTMECCYRTMQRNTAEIQEISEWVTQIRVELKKRLVNKQEMEQRNHEIYSYMHDVFGAEVLNLFDMKYNPEEQHPVAPAKKQDPNKE